ncbi:hypothetical protein PYW08_006481 [Mythimna loreyi]|uniref:Uncharacterized protein n=1 Tax=Mythimna loreyi TaxID=667449 RepID=A0ACC2QN37_9NEOP|nr:hypothetical protein PYW08_006481 [Mythimna loreyi]
MKSDQAYKHLAEGTDRAANNPNVITICIDLQQVLFCPTLTHSSVFYQRQLSCYNLGINNVGQRYSVMNLWNETIAKRGSAEIASCILKYILDNFKPLEENQERKLIVWSDRCVGQNNNWRILTLYAYLVKQQYFTEVNQKFLCSGHSFLPCDRDFTLIERRKKVRAHSHEDES